ncbi:MAG: hypothetical protein Ta2A_04750 [Treponemataceae bacterium]|nr:MAG: hypothetical protein Ta2A_04750 [Treponemataceae bacterium]
MKNFRKKTRSNFFSRSSPIIASPIIAKPVIGFFCMLVIGAHFCAFSQSSAPASAAAPAPNPATNPVVQKKTKTQTVSWELDPYAFYYNVVIEKVNAGKKNKEDSYTTVFSKEVDENFVELALHLGSYRYKVSAVNFLGKIESESDWSYFSVERAILPVIRSLESELVAPDEEGIVTVELSGENFDESARIFLRKAVNQNNVVNLIPRAITPLDTAIPKGGNSATVIFDADVLETGDYEIFLQNPDGFSTSYQFVTVSLNRSAESARNAKIGGRGGGKYKTIIELSAAIPFANPFVPFYGDAYDNYFSKSISFYSEKMRLDIIPFGTTFGYAGFELEPFWFLTKAETSRYTLSGHSAGALINAIFKFPIYKNYLHVNARFGVGYAAYINMQFDAKIFSDVMHDEITVGFPCGDGGISLQYYPFQKNRFFVDLSVDYIHLFAEGMPIGFLMTGLSAGYSW